MKPHPFRLFLAVAVVSLAVLLALPKKEMPTGYVPDPVGVQIFLRSLDQPYFAQAGADAMAKATHKDTFLYRHMDQAHQARYGTPFKVARQGIGDCVSWGAMHAVYCAESVDWTQGQRADPPLLPASEPIYGGARVEARGKPGDGARPVGGYSDGATGWGAAKWLKDWGVVYREPVVGRDLTTYSASRAKEYGAYGCGGQGDNGKMDAEAKKHPCKHVVAVKTWEELVAAVTSGYPVTIASSVGFNTTRDSDGYCRRSGVWMHQMAIVGLRFQENGSPRDGALIINSWGNYVGGGKWPDDMPDGCFWAEKKDVLSILGQGDSYAIGSIDGFDFRELDNGGWLAQ